MPGMNIVAVAFPDDTSAYRARSILGDLAVAEDLHVLNAAVLERDATGTIHVHDADTSAEGTGVAEIVELIPGSLDAAMTQLGDTVLRRPAEEVLAELEAADAALRAGQQEADQRMREKRRTEIKENYEQRKSALLGKLKRP